MKSLILGMVFALLSGSSGVSEGSWVSVGSETADLGSLEALKCSGVSCSESDVSTFRHELVKFMTYDYFDLVPVDDEDMYNWSLFITKLREDGISDNGIAGILGNIKSNGSVKPYYISGYTDSLYYGGDIVYDAGMFQPQGYIDYDGSIHAGEGHGICSWVGEKAEALSGYGCDSVAVTHYYADGGTEYSHHTCHLPDMETQIDFLLNDLNGDYVDVKEKLSEAASPSEAVSAYIQGYVQFYRPWSESCVQSAESCLPLVQACDGVIVINR